MLQKTVGEAAQCVPSSGVHAGADDAADEGAADEGAADEGAADEGAADEELADAELADSLQAQTSLPIRRLMLLSSTLTSAVCVGKDAVTRRMQEMPGGRLLSIACSPNGESISQSTCNSSDK